MKDINEKSERRLFRRYAHQLAIIPVRKGQAALQQALDGMAAQGCLLVAFETQMIAPASSVVLAGVDPAPPELCWFLIFRKEEWVEVPDDSSEAAE